MHLEGAGQFEKIVAPDMMVEHPMYRVTWGANPAVIEGTEGVLAFYRSVADAVLWHSDDLISVGDGGSRTSSPSTSWLAGRTCGRSATTWSTKTASTTS